MSLDNLGHWSTRKPTGSITISIVFTNRPRLCARERYWKLRARQFGMMIRRANGHRRGVINKGRKKNQLIRKQTNNSKTTRYVRAWAFQHSDHARNWSWINQLKVRPFTDYTHALTESGTWFFSRTESSRIEHDHRDPWYRSELYHQ